MSELCLLEEIPIHRFVEICWVKGITDQHRWGAEYFPFIVFKLSEQQIIFIKYVKYIKYPNINNGQVVDTDSSLLVYQLPVIKIIPTPKDLPQIVIDRIKEMTGKDIPQYSCDI